MIQHINLYRDILQEQQHKSAVRLIPWILLGLTFLLAATSAYLEWDLHQTRQQLKQRQQQVAETSAQLELLKASQPDSRLDNNLSAEVQSWQKRLNDIKQAIHLIHLKNQDGSSGFSGFLLALANQTVSNIWLTKITISGQPAALTLEGSTLNPIKIPELIEKLRRELIFNGQTFTKLTVNQVETHAQQVNFALISDTAKLKE